MAAKYPAAESVDFAEGDGFHPGPFEAEGEPAYS
jgi:hypothetical protein